MGSKGGGRYNRGADTEDVFAVDRFEGGYGYRFDSTTFTVTQRRAYSRSDFRSGKGRTGREGRSLRIKRGGAISDYDGQALLKQENHKGM